MSRDALGPIGERMGLSIFWVRGTDSATAPEAGQERRSTRCLVSTPEERKFFGKKLDADSDFANRPVLPNTASSNGEVYVRSQSSESTAGRFWKG